MVVLNGTMKVAPFDIRAPTPKENNYLKKGIDVIQPLKFVIYASGMLGINRIYLLESKQIMLWITYVISATLSTFLLYFMIFRSTQPSYSTLVIKETVTVEYFIIMFCSMFLYKETLRNCFRRLRIFDETLNINYDVTVPRWIPRGLAAILVSIFFVIFEYLVYFIVTDPLDHESMLIVYLAILAHDCEIVFFGTFMRLIMLRLRLLKALIAKTLSRSDADNQRKEIPIETLAENAELETTSMHRAYELLHNCAEQLNNVMSFPIVVMFFTAGLSTTLMLKNIFQSSQKSDTKTSMGILVYTLIRCIKYTIQVIIPCYYSSKTSEEVSLIRIMLHDALNNPHLEKIERRKLKAFFMLTQDNGFAYALWGVIRLNMSLPLSYTSLCTTYLVIIIQFSKFIE